MTNKVLSYWSKSSALNYKCTLDFSLFSLVDELLVVGNDSLGDGLSDGVDLSDITTSSDGDSNVKVLESLETQKKDWFHDLDSE